MEVRQFEKVDHFIPVGDKEGKAFESVVEGHLGGPVG